MIFEKALALVCQKQVTWRNKEVTNHIKSPKMIELLCDVELYLLVPQLFVKF